MICLNSNTVTPMNEDKKKKRYGNYKWSEDFYQLINNGICPVCNTKTIIKAGTEINCLICDLNILGSPETIAYYEDIPAEEIPAPTNQNICPECEGIKFQHDFKRDETVCMACGLVVEGPPAYSAYVQIKYPFNYTFDSEILWIKPKKGERIIGFIYPPNYYRDPQQLTAYNKI
jgi:hypothetical protein